MLSFMARGHFGESDFLFMPMVALGLFIAIFAIVTWRALRADKAAIADLASLPLVDDTCAAGPTQGAQYE